MVRSIGAVLVGYVVFAASAFAVFQRVGQPPHQEAPLGVLVASIAVGILAAIAGGYLGARLAGRQPLAHGVAVAMVVALGATVSLVSTVGHGAIWSQLAALALMAPSAAVGGWVRRGGDVAKNG